MVYVLHLFVRLLVLVSTNSRLVPSTSSVLTARLDLVLEISFLRKIYTSRCVPDNYRICLVYNCISWNYFDEGLVGLYELAQFNVFEMF